LFQIQIVNCFFSFFCSLAVGIDATPQENKRRLVVIRCPDYSACVEPLETEDLCYVRDADHYVRKWAASKKSLLDEALFLGGCFEPNAGEVSVITDAGFTQMLEAESDPLRKILTWKREPTRERTLRALLDEPDWQKRTIHYCQEVDLVRVSVRSSDLRHRVLHFFGDGRTSKRAPPGELKLAKISSKILTPPQKPRPLPPPSRLKLPPNW